MGMALYMPVLRDMCFCAPLDMLKPVSRMVTAASPSRGNVSEMPLSGWLYAGGSYAGSGGAVGPYAMCCP